jgi:hemerythrin
MCINNANLHCFPSDLHHEINQIDEDHQEIFKFASIMAFCLKNNDATYSAIYKCAELIQESICGHFYREAKAMSMSGYPNLSQHLAQHVIFCSSINDKVKSSSANDFDKLRTIPADVISWFSEHITTADVGYIEFFGADRIDGRPTSHLYVEADISNFQCGKSCHKRIK